MMAAPTLWRLKMKIAVAGGTGMIGAPVVETFLKYGHQVGVISRSAEMVEARFGKRVQPIIVDPDYNHVQGLLEGFESLHISLAGSGSPRSYYKQADATKKLVAEAGDSGIGYITYLSGATVGHPDSKQFYDNDAKLIAEDSIMSSGLLYRIFRPSWFLETLPLFVRRNRLTIIGKSFHGQAWLSTGDFANVVLDAHLQKPASSIQWVGGPENVPLTEAFYRYARKLQLQTSHLSTGFARLLAFMGGGWQLRHVADLMAYFSQVPDQPNGSDGQIHTPTGFSEWLERQI